MDTFLSCDWGTSAFRLRLCNLENAEVIAAENTDEGIFSTFTSWQKSGKTDEAGRFAFFLDVIRQKVHIIENKLNTSLAGVPLVISGMASSTIGMKPLPYGELPFALDGSDLLYDYTEAVGAGQHSVLLVSGIKAENDVMRGEETQLMGCVDGGTHGDGEQLYIFPGTHSKHIVVQEGLVTGFRTFMTGELFELLSQHSILSASVENSPDLQTPECHKAFEQGVQDSIGTNLLHACFRVRTNSLFDKLSKKENYHYLSGLVIGSELHELQTTRGAQTEPAQYNRICLCCGSRLKNYYETALSVLGLSPRLFIFNAQIMDEAVIKGQRKILLKKLTHE